MAKAVLVRMTKIRARLKRLLAQPLSKDAFEQWKDELRVIEYKLKAKGEHIRLSKPKWRKFEG
jgi:hypothetical protein